MICFFTVIFLRQLLCLKKDEGNRNVGSNTAFSVVYLADLEFLTVSISQMFISEVDLSLGRREIGIQLLCVCNP